MTYLISLLLFIALICISMAICGVNALFLFDIFSLLLILLSVIPMLFVSGMGKDLIRSFSIVTRNKDTLTIKQLKRCKEALSLTMKLLLCSCTLFFILPFFAHLYLCVPTEQISVNIAVDSIILVYALFPCFLLLPVHAKISAQLINLQKED